MLLPCLYIAPTRTMDRGVFTAEPLEKNTIVEIAPVILMSGQERLLLDQTLLHDYIFEWGEASNECVVALGYVSMYNHSYRSNCEYEMEFDNRLIRIRTVRKIKANEELFINYNGDWNDPKPLWFDAR